MVPRSRPDRHDIAAAADQSWADLPYLGLRQRSRRLSRLCRETRPENPEAHWNLANALLVSGDFARGFAEYEWRFKRAGRGEPPRALPRWTGEALNGATIVLGLEQGAGDAIHFVRFAAEVAARGGRVVIECQPPLRKLLSTAPDVSATVDPGMPVPGAAGAL